MASAASRAEAGHLRAANRCPGTGDAVCHRRGHVLDAVLVSEFGIGMLIGVAIGFALLWLLDSRNDDGK